MISSSNFVAIARRVYYLHKSNPVAKKRPRKPETSIKDAFKEKEHEAVSNSVVTIPSGEAGLPSQKFRF